MKKHFATFVLVCMFLSARAFSQGQYVFDNGEMLSDTERSALEARIAAIKRAYSFDVVLVTEESIYGEEPMVYADDFFDYQGGGFGNENGGVLLLQVTGTRDYCISTFGVGTFGGETIFNELALDASEKHIVKFFKADNSFGAYNTFIDDVEKYLAIAAKGGTYNFLYEYILVFIIIAWVIAFIIAAVVVNRWKAKMNTAKGSGEAAAYIVPKSLQFTEKTDTYLYSTTTSMVRASSSSSSGHSSSHSHTSSSGRSHGGRSGHH
jgi:uncharacterized protein